MFFKTGVLKNFANFIGKHHCWSTFRSSCSQVFFKVGILKNFTIFTEKRPCGTLFLIKLQAWRPITLTKRCFPVFIAKFLRTAFFTEPGCSWTNSGGHCASLCGEVTLWSFSTSLSLLNLLTKSHFTFKLYCGVWISHVIITHFVYMNTLKWLVLKESDICSERKSWNDSYF